MGLDRDGVLPALFVVVLALALALGAGGCGGDDGDRAREGERAPRGAASLDERFRGIPQDGAVLGRPHAPFTLIEFADVQCPFCAQFDRTVLPAVLDEFVRPGELRLELRPVSFLGADSTTGAAATVAAGTQDRMWQFADLFYRNQGPENSGYVTPEFLGGIAAAAGLEFEAWQKQSNSQSLVTELEKNARDAHTARVRSTPSFRLGRTGKVLAPFDGPSGDRDRFIAMLRLELR